MKIERIDIYKIDIPVAYPATVAIGSIDSASNIMIKITADTGEYGWGEGSPFAPITGDSQASNYETAQQLAVLLKGKNPLAIEVRVAEMNRFTVGESSIRCAFDIALYDLAAKVSGLPLYAFLGGEQRPIHTNLTIGLQETVEKTLERAEKILAAGFKSIKMKTGRKHLEDVAHVAAVRALAGPDVLLKIDSNQGWSYQDAVANIRAMENLDLMYSEQPIAAWDYDGLARLRKSVDLPICADEAVFDDKDALKLVKQGAVDYLNIKLGKSGGVSTALRINAIAEAAGCQCMIGCFAETRLALTAAAHLAMARPNIQFLDLDSAYKHLENPIIGGLVYAKDNCGLIRLPETPGHGAVYDEGAISTTERVAI
ncbi:dipeptide epimerase [Porticoccaceae bacterium]|nr:dipeptide epimerase [Porticoccaceae bacterium]